MSLSRSFSRATVLSRLSRRFAGDQSAVSAVVFSLSLIPLSLSVAAAVDLSQINRYKATLDAAADSGVIAGLSSSVVIDGQAAEVQKAASEAAALSMFNAEAPKSGVTVNSVRATFTAASGATPASVEIRYTATVRSILGDMGFSWLNIGGSAIANAATASGAYTNIYVLLDVSASMGLGVDIPTQTAMVADPEMRECSFACHSPDYNTAAIARRKGYMLRFDAVKAQIDAMLSDLSNKYGNSPKSTVQLAIYGFDNGFRQISALGPNMALHRVALNGADFTLVGGGTSLRNALVEMKKVIPTPGDGSSASKPKVAVLLVSDGVANSVQVYADGRWDPSPTAYPPFSNKWCWDQNPPPTDGPWYPPVGAPKSFPCMPDPWTPTHAGSQNQELLPIDPAWCSDLKNAGVRLMTLYTRYDFPVPKTGSGDWQTKEWRYPLMYYYLIPKLQGPWPPVHLRRATTSPLTMLNRSGPAWGSW